MPIKAPDFGYHTVLICEDGDVAGGLLAGQTATLHSHDRPHEGTGVC